MKTGFEETESWHTDPSMWLVIRTDTPYFPTSKPSKTGPVAADQWTDMVDRYFTAREAGINMIQIVDPIDSLFNERQPLSESEYARIRDLTAKFVELVKKHNIKIILHQHKPCKRSEYLNRDIDTFQMTSLKARSFAPQQS